MPEQDPLADVISLVAAPIAGAVRSVEQFRTGVDEFLRGIENFNRTMENLNETAERMNVLLKEVEEPIKAAVPQVTRAINNADEVMQVVSGPAMAAAPGLARLADTMNTPAFQQLPDQLATFSDVLVDMSSRMAPLSQFAETAGGLFGLRKPGAGQRTTGQAARVPDTAVIEEDDLEEDDLDAATDAADEATEPARVRSAGRTKPPAKKATSKSLVAKARRSGISAAAGTAVPTTRSAKSTAARRERSKTSKDDTSSKPTAKKKTKDSASDEPASETKDAESGKSSTRKKDSGSSKSSAKKPVASSGSSAGKPVASGKSSAKKPAASNKSSAKKAESDGDRSDGSSAATDAEETDAEETDTAGD